MSAMTPNDPFLSGYEAGRLVGIEVGARTTREQIAREILNNPRLHGDLVIHNHELGQVCPGCLMLAQATNDAAIARGEG